MMVKPSKETLKSDDENDKTQRIETIESLTRNQEQKKSLGHF